MWIRKTYISVLCICVVAANPLLAVASPCCCTKKSESKPTCCHAKSLKTSPSEAIGRPCCNRKSAPTGVTKESCRCCVKAVPQSIPTRGPLIKTSPDLTFVLWSPPQFSLSAGISSRNTDIEGPHRPSGPRLLALYCKWLE